MRILGLTGSIAMGKSTAAAMLRRLGVPVHDADATVHGLLGGAALSGVRAAFPEAVVGGMVDRAALGARVFGDHAALRRLEGILHPLVRRAEQRFLRRAAVRRASVVVLDVPLLFETGGEGRCDAVVLVTAPRFLQTQRVLRRSGMTLDKLNAIRICQAPEAEKRRRADFVVPTGLGCRLTMQRLRRVLTVLSGRPARHWPPRPWPAARGYRHA
ncbi:MAG: dephospho-CoA kinase [Rhodospirillaceae bacterium]|nr:MAG: dephospho-CoA kinase [Rhodospirillaceae bacterium]